MRNLSINPFFEVSVADKGEHVDLRHLGQHSSLLQFRPVTCYIIPDGAIHSAEGEPSRDAPSMVLVGTMDNGLYAYMQISAPMFAPVIKEVTKMMIEDELWRELL